ncbi:conserved hypothetical protein [Arcobacter nitrofigilis DSM 7299]|uniref:Uncharacterized protein n=1 Tax=Arcobacter nitrofigilis (strain ATCC 33309 / DSM 7299 / CCUG 15893 / LMG 7604 / NCTC 12251 / CI) TaxID=572480 RepID=D5V7Q4_ARCNC|nr:hypothetical protein [Arcobacter nitrofigilis]ADG94674.1 conserved hypothetical protein [Arcobacter nitrofigilis DSM 7299]
MKIYIYAKSGHAIGLEATRTCSAIASKLKEYDPILCTCDFRAGAYAKEELGIKKYVSVDLLTNLPNIMQRGDILIFDSDETTDVMEKHMKDFCSLLYKVGEDTPHYVVDNNLFKKNLNPKFGKTLFFGDDDYNNLLLELTKNSSKKQINLLLGHYFFLGNETKLAPYFETLFTDEDYVNTISNSEFLLTTSIQSCMESIACGNKPVLLFRKDKSYNLKFIENLNLPTINYNENLDKIVIEFEDIISSYPNLNDIKIFDFKPLVSQIRKKTSSYNNLNSSNI